MDCLSPSVGAPADNSGLTPRSKYFNSLARQMKNCRAFVSKVINSLRGGNGRGLDDDRQAEAIRQYLAPEWRATAERLATVARGSETQPVTRSQEPAAALGANEAEEFWGEGFDACLDPGDRRVFLKNPAHECCLGVDLPGMGHVHSADCVAIMRRKEMPETMADFVSEPACRRAPDQIGVEVRELIAEIDAERERQPVANSGQPVAGETRGLWAELLFAARDLAESNLVSYRGVPGDDPTPGGGCHVVCRDCAHLVDMRPHNKLCQTGRTLAAVNAILGSNFSSGKEAEGERQPIASSEQPVAGAGDGIRPRGFPEPVCVLCGARGFESWMPEEVDREPDLALLGLNQCVRSYLLGTRRHWLLYTHNCEGPSAEVIDMFRDKDFGEGGAQ